MSRGCLAAILAAAILVMFVPRPWINPTLALVGLFLMAAAWALVYLRRPFELRFRYPVIALAGVIVWAICTSHEGDTRLALLMWLGNLAVFCIAMQAGRRLLDTLLYFAFALCLLAVVQYFSGVSKIFWLFPTDAPSWGPFVNRDQYAAFIEMVLPLALVGALGGGSRTWRFALMAAAMYASVIAGASRAGAILTTAEIAIVPLLCGRRRRVHTVAVWLLAAVFVSVAGGATLWHRFQDPDPFAGRREILAGTLAMVRARPWTGFGLGSFRTVYPAYAPLDFGSVVQHAHNDWVEWAEEGGIPFALLVFSVAVWSAPRVLRTVWGIGAVAIMLHALVDFPLHTPALELWLFALLGVLASESTADPARWSFPRRCS
ncbi:MAG TPA: O-antigen ligase family protein [Bryobacteraceae bacterium]|jgi:O-antigen ligase|nr:O-antigen ligase family protein [Bryobacteraceae bacterium]